MVSGRKFHPKRDTATARLHDLNGGIDFGDPVDRDDEDRPVVPFVVLPSQWRQKESELCGCKRLLVGILTDAFLTLQRPQPGKWGRFELTRQEAVEWFTAPDAEVSVNLRDVVDGLGLDLGRIQGAALRVADGAMRRVNYFCRSRQLFLPVSHQG